MVSASTRSAIERVFASLDWKRLGTLDRDEGGDAFWAEHREPAIELGCAWADALVRRVVPGGTSLYVGAGVAELPAMLAEVVERGRTVLAANRRDAECRVLSAALDAAGVGGIELHAGGAEELAGRGPFDHLAMVSVLSDPETWPVVSGVTYGRLPPVLVDVAAFERERQEIQKLVHTLASALARPATVTTTVDEVPWLLAWAAERGAVIDADDEVIDTAIVGDPIGFLTVR